MTPDEPINLGADICREAWVGELAADVQVRVVDGAARNRVPMVANDERAAVVEKIGDVAHRDGLVRATSTSARAGQQGDVSEAEG